MCISLRAVEINLEANVVHILDHIHLTSAVLRGMSLDTLP